MTVKQHGLKSCCGSFSEGPFENSGKICSTPGSFRESALVLRSENIVLNIETRAGPQFDIVGIIT